MKNFRILLIISITLLFSSYSWGQTQTDTFRAYFATTPPVIDGNADDACWAKANWYNISKVWLPSVSSTISAADFTGKYKLSWDKNYLYLLVEVVDDSLCEVKTNLLTNYWWGDCVEVFLDEDRSKGDHLNNYNAFAYHTGPTGKVVDIGTDGKSLYLDNNLSLKVITVGHKSIWEFAIKVFNSSFNPTSPDASRIQLAVNKVMGFSLAYCDNDGTNSRQHFIGSMTLTDATANENYKTASYFGSLKLMTDDAPATSIINTPIETSAILYPIPTSGNLVVDLKSNFATQIKIYNTTGQLVISENIKSQTSNINVSKLNKGVYIVEILNNNTKINTSKIAIK
jgi:hypothetical protein